MEFNPNEFDKLAIKGNASVIQMPPKPKSVFLIGDKDHRFEVYVYQHFNWFQKLLWKFCFGIKVEDYEESEDN